MVLGASLLGESPGLSRLPKNLLNIGVFHGICVMVPQCSLLFSATAEKATIRWETKTRSFKWFLGCSTVA
jgi:hypothetical protein